jgi:membrane protease subunit (stomatin/prohibitin family)
MLMLAAGMRAGQNRAQQQMAQAEAYRQQGAQEAMAQQQATQVAAPAQDDVIAQIERLAALHKAGALSDEEFAAAKKKLLG